MKEKLSKVKDIFLEKEDTSNAAESARPRGNIEKTPNKGQLYVSDLDKSSARPNTNVSKAKELEELAKLIQAATGTINNVVESSANLGHFSRFDRKRELLSAATDMTTKTTKIDMIEKKI